MNSNKRPKLYIHAVNIHGGGGASLLNALTSAKFANADRVVLADSRFVALPNLPANLKIKRVKPSIIQRTKAEFWLAKTVRDEDLVLCFGNLPPLFRLRCHTLVFVQNRYLVENISLADFSLRSRLRIMIERFWFRVKATNSDEFIVQTMSMKRLLETSKLPKHIPIGVKPFAALKSKTERVTVKSPDRDTINGNFLYVASGEPHKNHRNLIDAWCLMSKEGLLPKLQLTLEQEKWPDLCQYVEEQKNRFGLNTENLGKLSSDEILSLYKKARALVYPSYFESFGLPLIEAQRAGLPILASELDYVRDVVEIDQSFNPNSPLSMVRAIKRFVGLAEKPLPILSAEKFLGQIWHESQ